MIENFNKSANVPRGLGFNFDILIVHLNLPNVNVQDNSKLTVDVKFNNNNIKITSSRINVNEFKSGHSLEFFENPSSLRDQLIRNPLECQVNYDDNPVGTCTFIYPDSFINCIAEGCGRELTCCDEADVKKDNQVVGRMEIIARLQIKCDEFEENQVLLQPKINVCNPSDNILNTNDVMFLVGEQKYGSIACTDVDIIPASESGTSAHATCLDLSEFRHVHGKILPNTDILDSIDAQCCKTKKSSNQYEQMMKHLLDKSKESTSCLKNKAEQQICLLQCEQQRNFMDLISESRFASCSSTDSYQLCHCTSDENGTEDKSQNDGVIEKPTKKYCPLCHDNITWLPKFATCPKCGFKPISYNIQEKPYDNTLTANKILQEYNSNADENVMNHPSCISIKNFQNAIPCRCTCKNYKMCAHCRIKKLCEDIFQPTHKGDGDCGKCETKSADLYNICKTGSHDCRTYLTTVFEELKHLFDIYETEKKNVVVGRKDELKKIAQNSKNINRTQEVNRRRKKLQNSNRSHTGGENTDAERKKFLVKNFQKHVVCKNKVFDYNNPRKYNVMKMGHKSCFSGKTIVPRKMGWLWNTETKGLRTGWMPGAIRKPIKVLMQHFLNKNVALQVNERCDKNINEETDYTKETILHICKRNGVYYITLSPLKNVGTVKECIGHVNMKPIQFKITKNPISIKISQLKQYLKDLGFAKCNCHKPISNCCCRSYLDKKKLEYQCRTECHKIELPNCTDNLILSDTTDSEAEFDFGVTPPAGVVVSPCLKKREKVSSATQYVEDDWKLKPHFPKPTGKLHNCAVGNRFGKAFGPYGTKGYSPGAVPMESIYGPCGIIQERIKRKRGGNIAVRGHQPFRGADGKFNMAQYIAYKDQIKSSPEEIAEKKKQKMKLLRGSNPPLLCKVDRRGKPTEICSSCLRTSHNAICLTDNRIC